MPPLCFLDPFYHYPVVLPCIIILCVFVMLCMCVFVCMHIDMWVWIYVCVCMYILSVLFFLRVMTNTLAEPPHQSLDDLIAHKPVNSTSYVSVPLTHSLKFQQQVCNLHRKDSWLYYCIVDMSSMAWYLERGRRESLFEFFLYQ